MELQDWLDIFEKLERAFREGRTARLTPETAFHLANAARTKAANPTRNELAMAYCVRRKGDKCADPCFGCQAKANIAERVYTGRTFTD